MNREWKNMCTCVPQRLTGMVEGRDEADLHVIHSESLNLGAVSGF